MKRVLVIVLLVLLATAFSAYARAEEQTAERTIAFTIKVAGDEARAEDTANALLFINALRALGGDIHLEGDRVIIKLELTPEKVEALRLALKQDGFAVANVHEYAFSGDQHHDAGCTGRGSHERFLLGKKCRSDSTKQVERGAVKKIIIKMDGGKNIEVMEVEPGGMPEMRCPHCGKTFRPDRPMMMHPPMPPFGEEFRQPIPPELDPHAKAFSGMMPGMGAMHEEAMREFQLLREEMERLRAEQGELWRALEELHMRLDCMDEAERAKWEDMDELWRALDRLYMEMDEDED